MFKICPFYHLEYQRRIRKYMTLKIKVKVIFDKWHLKSFEWTISDSFKTYKSKGRPIGNFICKHKRTDALSLWHQ